MLELYQAEGCPFCETVRSKLTELGLSYVVHNPRTAAGEPRNEQTLDELRTVGGEDQIPFLVDTDRRASVYESDAIVDYLEQHYGRATVTQ
ncbi:MAG: glutathione S-transferase N-terminal domain-containing protein [Halobacteriales archaeon]